VVAELPHGAAKVSNSYFNELLGTIVERSRAILERGRERRASGRDLTSLTEALVAGQGEASGTELEEAAAWMSGESDVMGELERPLAGVVAQVCEILSADEELPEDRP
jgi:hypothetical protein